MNRRDQGPSSPTCAALGRVVARRAFILLMSALSAACSQLADYQRPAAPVAATWPDPVAAAGRDIATQIHWRSVFPDPRLQVLITAALEYNRDMRIAVARVEEARAQYGVTRADRLPTVNASLSRNAAMTPGSLGGTNQSASGQRYDFSMAVVSYEIDFWGRVNGLTEAARASYLATEEARRALRLSLVSDVANAYFSQRETEERLALARSAVALREKSRALVARARDSGFASNLDYLQANGAVESARAEVAALEREYAAAGNMLRFLVGDVPDGLPPVRPLAEQEVAVDLFAGVPSEVLVSRPDVLAAEQRLMAAHASVGAARAAFLPKILLTSSFGVASRALASLFMPTSRMWAYQPVLTMPLFDAGRSAANFDVAAAREVMAVAEYEKTIQSAFREVADLLAARSTFGEQVRAAQANVTTQEERLRISQALYSGGQASYLEVLDAQRELFATQQTLAQVRRMRLVAAAQLYKALGGGEL